MRRHDRGGHPAQSQREARHRPQGYPSRDVQPAVNGGGEKLDIEGDSRERRRQAWKQPAHRRGDQHHDRQERRGGGSLRGDGQRTRARRQQKAPGPIAPDGVPRDSQGGSRPGRRVRRDQAGCQEPKSRQHQATEGARHGRERPELGGRRRGRQETTTEVRGAGAQAVRRRLDRDCFPEGASEGGRREGHRRGERA